MEPKSPELHQHVPSVEQQSSGLSPETSQDNGLEQRVERSPEQSSLPPQAMPPLPSVVQLPTPIAQPATDDSSNSVVDDTPSVAADEDLIEKEWVDKAKKIILDTKDDPFTREREVGRLQTDYLRKRYGKEIGSSGD